MGESMNIPLLLIIGFSLSLDAFSLSLSFTGPQLQYLKKKRNEFISI